jgi:hypothetical protein
MNIKDQTEDQSARNTILVLVGISVCCCLAAVGLYIVAFASSLPLLIETARRTPTPISLTEVNSVSPLGKFYFGRKYADNFCHINEKVDEFSQEDLLRDRYLNFSVPFASKYQGKHLTWFVYDEYGKKIDIGKPRYTLDADLENCFEGLVSLSPRSEPGRYFLEIYFENQLAFKEVFTITYSDLTKVPRPKRKPLGDFSVGRNINSTETTCNADGQLASTAEMLDDPWFYIVSPYQLSDIDKKFYWTVRDEKGKAIFNRVERVIDDDIDLCLWQGFSMESSKPGVYTVVIEDTTNKILYQTTFELK